MDDMKDRVQVAEVKSALAEEEFRDVKDKVDRAKVTLDELGGLLDNALFLHNGKLSTGTIDYAAFRVETLSLIFEVAHRTLRRRTQAGDQAYDEFLFDLGDEVGFTFARDLVRRLRHDDLFVRVQDPQDLLELWARFENDTGAGITKIRQCTRDRVVIELANSPLRASESRPHAHCGFYCYYIQALLNEIHTSRARILQQQIVHTSVAAFTAMAVTEQPDAQDNCVFVAELRPEVLTTSFDRLTEAYSTFDQLNPDDDYSACMGNARAALVTAQMETIGLKGDRPPRDLHKLYKDLLGADEFRRMHDAYQRASKHIHRESQTTSQLQRADAWELLRDVRRSVYALELLDLDEATREELRQRAALNEQIDEVRKLIQESNCLVAEQREEAIVLLSQARNRKLGQEEDQARLAQLLKAAGESVWDVASPILLQVAPGGPSR